MAGIRIDSCVRRDLSDGDILAVQVPDAISDRTLEITPTVDVLLSVDGIVMPILSRTTVRQRISPRQTYGIAVLDESDRANAACFTSFVQEIN